MSSCTSLHVADSFVIATNGPRWQRQVRLCLRFGTRMRGAATCSLARCGAGAQVAACCSHHVFCRLACGSCAAVVIERLAAAGVSGHASLACLCSCLVRRERMREGGGGALSPCLACVPLLPKPLHARSGMSRQVCPPLPFFLGWVPLSSHSSHSCKH